MIMTPCGGFPELCFGTMGRTIQPHCLFILKMSVFTTLRYIIHLNRLKNHFFFGFGPKIVVFLLSNSSFLFLMFVSHNTRMLILSLSILDFTLTSVPHFLCLTILLIYLDISHSFLQNIFKLFVKQGSHTYVHARTCICVLT